jgi:pyruvate dehydrogenase E1 component beta subunit
MEECFYDLDQPVVRISTPHIPLPSADALEDAVVPSVARIVDDIVRAADFRPGGGIAASW